MDDPKEIGNLMNKTFVPIANKFTKERKNGVYESNDKCCFDSVSNYFAFREISEGEIENYIKNIKANKSVSCDVVMFLVSGFIKLSAKVIVLYF